MITTGSKLLLGATVAAIVSAVMFAWIDQGKTGTFGLIAAATALALAAGVNLFTRDANVSSMDPASLTDAPAAQSPVAPSMWPLVAAFGAGLLVLGFVTTSIAAYLGLIVLAAAGAEWAVTAWSDGASSSRTFNSTLRARLSHPLEFPILGVIAVGLIVYLFSRIMLVLSKVGSPIVFGAVAVVVMLAGFLVANVRNARPAAIGGALGVAFVGLAAGGVAAGISGEREFHHHETWAGLAAEGSCDQAEEVEADHNASQTVANKANINAEITLTEGEELVAHVIGVGSNADSVTFVKSNPTNVMFHNDSDHHRRLVLNLATAPVETESGETEEMPVQVCTAMVEPGGSQFMTFVVARSNVAHGTEYSFTVPGLEGPSVEVVVP